MEGDAVPISLELTIPPDVARALVQAFFREHQAGIQASVRQYLRLQLDGAINGAHPPVQEKAEDAPVLPSSAGAP